MMYVINRTLSLKGKQSNMFIGLLYQSNLGVHRHALPISVQNDVKIEDNDNIDTKIIYNSVIKNAEQFKNRRFPKSILEYTKPPLASLKYFKDKFHEEISTISKQDLVNCTKNEQQFFNLPFKKYDDVILENNNINNTEENNSNQQNIDLTFSSLKDKACKCISTM